MKKWFILGMTSALLLTQGSLHAQSAPLATQPSCVAKQSKEHKDTLLTALHKIFTQDQLNEFQSYKYQQRAKLKQLLKKREQDRQIFLSAMTASPAQFETAFSNFSNDEMQLNKIRFALLNKAYQMATPEQKPVVAEQVQTIMRKASFAQQHSGCRKHEQQSQV